MRWEGERESSNVEDYRDGGGGGGGFGFGGRSIGIGTIVIALVGGAIFGINPLTILGLLSGGGRRRCSSRRPRTRRRRTTARRSSCPTVLADTEDVWTQVFAQGGATLPADPKLVLFDGTIRTGCGAGQSAMGPFYCPADQKVYIDLGFYRTLQHAAGRAGRVRAGLRHRARGGPPRAAPAGHHGPGRPAARTRQPGRRATR